MSAQSSEPGFPSNSEGVLFADFAAGTASASVGTDDQGRYVIPDPPKRITTIFVRDPVN